MGEGAAKRGGARVVCAVGPDNAGHMVWQTLGGAKRVIDATFFEIGDAYIGALTAAARRGVIVRVCVDAHGDGEVRHRAAFLNSHGVECRLLSEPGVYAHAKLVVIDESALLIGTGNLNGHDLDPHRDAMRGTREWWVGVEAAPTLVRQARAHVMRNWRAATPALAVAGDGELVLTASRRAPRAAVKPLALEMTPRRLRLTGGGSGVRALEEELLSGVRQRALVVVPYVTPAAPAVATLLGALTTHRRRGIDVRLLLGRPPDAGGLGILAHIEAEVRVMPPGDGGIPRGHAKGLICDDAVLVGSANWSESGLTGNDEAALVIAHPQAAAYYAAVYDADWETALPLADLPR